MQGFYDWLFRVLKTWLPEHWLPSDPNALAANEIMLATLFVTAITLLFTAAASVFAVLSYFKKPNPDSTTKNDSTQHAEPATTAKNSAVKQRVSDVKGSVLQIGGSNSGNITITGSKGES